MRFNMPVAIAVVSVGGIFGSQILMVWPPLATTVAFILLATLAVIAGAITRRV